MSGEMEVRAIGVKRLSGKGKQNNAYDFSTLSVLVAIDPVAKETFQVQGYGYEVIDMDIDNDLLPKFAQVVFPCALQLIIRNEPSRRGLKAVISDFKVVQPSAVRSAA